jgi:hypothetical protein
VNDGNVGGIGFDLLRTIGRNGSNISDLGHSLGNGIDRINRFFQIFFRTRRAEREKEDILLFATIDVIGNKVLRSKNR